MTSYSVTTERVLQKVTAPNLPLAPREYVPQYQDQLNSILRLYFNRLESFLGQLMTSSQLGTVNNPMYTSFSDGEVDAFGRLRVGAPYTLFDSSQRYASDISFDYSTATGGTTAFQANKAATLLSVTTTTNSAASAQTFRSFPYQPGKSLLLLSTFSMATPAAGLVQRVGLFNSQNGVFFEANGTTLNLVIRSYTTGAVVETRIPQSQWNGDPLTGAGDSKIALDVTKTQIFYTDLEWLGVGAVRCGFVLNGQYVRCHTFYNANSKSFVYMSTATLPVRYEITNTGTASGALQMICCSVMSEGGYEQTSQVYWARNTATVSLGTSFVPIVSIRLNSSRLGAVVLPHVAATLPIANGSYEIALIKNATLTGASWVTGTFPDVDYDVTATAMTYSATNIVQLDYSVASNQSTSNALAAPSYKWDLQLGASQAGVSDTLTLCARVISGTGSIVGSLSFIDLSL